MRRPLLAAATLWCAGLAAGPAAAQSYFWTGGTNNAGVSGNWDSTLWTLQGSPNTPNVGPPQPGASATIQIGNNPFTVTVSDAESVGSLTFNNRSNGTLFVAGGGTLTVTGAFFMDGTLNNSGNGLVLNGAFTWNGGSIVAGTVTANFGGTINGGALAGGNLTYGGTNQAVTWTGGTINLSGGAAFTIGSGVTVTKTGSLNPHIQLDTTGVLGTESFTNAGTLIWTGNATTLTIDNGILFTNSGTVSTTSGTVWVQGVATTTGAFDTGNSTSGTGTTVLNGGGTTRFNPGASILGTGTFQIGGGSANTVTLNAAVPASTITTLINALIQSVPGGTGSFNVSGPFNLNGGTIGGGSGTGTATITATGGGTISTSVSTVTTGGAVNLNAPAAVTATYTWSGAGVTLGGTGALSVGTGATLLATGNSGITGAAGATATFTITGTFLKNGGTSTTTIGGAGLTLVNTGTVDVETGALSLTGPVNNTGTLTVNTTGTAGIISVDSGGTLNLNTGTAVTGTGTLRINSGTAVLNVNADTAVAPTFDVEAGTVQGSRTLTVNGPLTWSGGTVGGTATVKATNGGVVNATSTVTTGVVELAGGTFTWSAGSITLNGTGTLLRIDAGATLSNTNGSDFAATGSPVLLNAGTFEKVTSTSNATIPGNLTFNNTGTVKVTVGTLVVDGTFTNTGTVNVPTGSVFFINGGSVTLSPGTVITGAGTIQMDSSGTLTVNTAVSAGTGLNLVRGTVTGTGTLTLAGPFNVGIFDTGSIAGAVTVNAAGGGAWTTTPRISTGTVNLTGLTTTLSGADITFTGSGAIGIAPGATLKLTDDHGFGVSAGTPSVSVAGLLQKSGGAGTSTIPAGLNFGISGGGVLDVASGTVALRAPTANNGTIQVGAATAGTLSFDQAVTLTGSGQIAVGPVGVVNVNLPTAATTVTVPAGMGFSNAGTVQVFQGVFRIDPAATLANYTAATSTLGGGTWVAQNATIDLGRAVGTIASGTTVSVSGSTAAVTGLTALTQVSGQLRLASGAAVTPAATVGVAGVVEASGTLGTAVTVQAGGTLTGGGAVNGAVTVQSGGAVAPGPGPFLATGTAQLTVGTTTLGGGSKYVWEVNSWASNPSPGGQYDQLKGLSGAVLNLSGASAGNPVTLKIVSLNGTTPGQLPTFDPSVSRSWVIADFSAGNATGGVQSFAANLFTLDASSFANQANSTQFSLSTDASSNQLILSYTAVVPEPPLVLAAAALAFVGRRGFK
jgi:hypothetical protein